MNVHNQLDTEVRNLVDLLLEFYRQLKNKWKAVAFIFFVVGSLGVVSYSMTGNVGSSQVKISLGTIGIAKWDYAMEVAARQGNQKLTKEMLNIPGKQWIVEPKEVYETVRAKYHVRQALRGKVDLPYIFDLSIRRPNIFMVTVYGRNFKERQSLIDQVVQDVVGHADKIFDDHLHILELYAYNVGKRLEHLQTNKSPAESVQEDLNSPEKQFSDAIASLNLLREYYSSLVAQSHSNLSRTKVIGKVIDLGRVRPKPHIYSILSLMVALLISCAYLVISDLLDKHYKRSYSARP